MNLYTYVHNNPLRYIDPSGHCVAGKDAGCFVDSFSGVDHLINDVVVDNNSWLWRDLEGAKKGASEVKIKEYAAAQKQLEAANDAIRNNPCSYVDCSAGTAEFIGIEHGYAVLQYSVNGETNTYTITPNGVISCNCFTAGTTVVTDQGEKPIEEIRIGDKVLSKNDKTGEIAFQEVELLFQKTVNETFNITVNGIVIKTTDEHPFWVTGNGWVKAKDLLVGDILESSDGSHQRIEAIEIESKSNTVYNFRVKDFHTYFVSNLQIWTHNQGYCGEWSTGVANTYVYYGIRNGQRVYVGITTDLDRRAKEHGDRFDKLEPINKAPITRREGRAIEQTTMNNNPHFENKINSISATRSWYGRAIKWANDWLDNQKRP